MIYAFDSLVAIVNGPRSTREPQCDEIADDAQRDGSLDTAMANDGPKIRQPAPSRVPGQMGSTEYDLEPRAACSIFALIGNKAHAFGRQPVGRFFVPAGGVGTALLQLLRAEGVGTYGAASLPKHGTVRKFGATPLDYRAAPIDRLVRALEPHSADPRAHSGRHTAADVRFGHQY